MKEIRLKITQILTKLLIHPSWMVTRAQQRERAQSQFCITAPDVSELEGQLVEPCRNRALFDGDVGESASTEPDDGRAT